MMKVLGSVLVVSLMVVTGVTAYCKGSRKYVVEFDYNWTKKSHPVDYPSFQAFSPLVCAAHVPTYSMWKRKTMASRGIQDIAEFGDTRAMVKELKTADDVLYWKVGPSASGTGRARVVVEVRGETNSFLISCVTMIAPSPDWIVGFRNIRVCKKSKWIKSMFVGDLPGWDAGTDSGKSYESANLVTRPQGYIHRLRGLPTKGVSFGRYKIYAM